MLIYFLVKGLGEYAQATAIASRLREKGEEVWFITDSSFLENIIHKDHFLLKKIEEKTKINDFLRSLQADALFLCNAHTTFSFELSKPPYINKVFSLDSNWLFNNAYYTSHQVYEWIDTPYILFSKTIFESNLIKNNGYYKISDLFASKIYTPGFIPSNGLFTMQEKNEFKKKLNIKTTTKLVGMYFGLNTFHTKSYSNLIQAYVPKIKDLVNRYILKSGKDIQIIDFSGPDFNVYSSQMYNNFLLVCDFVIMHHGYGTIPKLLHSAIPTLCYTDHPKDSKHHSFYELSPLIKAGAIKHLFYDEDQEQVLPNFVEAYLYDESQISMMKMAQKKVFVTGENNLISHFYRQYLS